MYSFEMKWLQRSLRTLQRLLLLLLLVLLLFQEFSSGTLEIHVNDNPQQVVQLPPQSTTHKTFGVMINKDVSGKLALPQFQCDGKMTD